jgi:phosphatidylserine/phosphatidylglycerophosphate/cardiolipin synthase-like enzyme
VKSSFLKLSRPTLNGIADALDAGRLSLPISPVAICSYVVDGSLPKVMTELNQLYEEGMAIGHIAYMLRLLAAERAQSQMQQDHISLVWSGPEVPGTESRDTGIVIRELFNSAKSSVLISSFAIDQGTKGYELFGPLSKRMDSNPNLQVRMFLNIKRKYRDTTPPSVLIRQFSETFRHDVWPGERLPEVFHDPRAIMMTADSNACLHAKCVVVDEERLLITSANFTEAAHERNIEAGILMTDRVIARAVRSQFEMLVACKTLMRVAGL